MKFAKTALQPVDLDELARELEQAALSSLPKSRAPADAAPSVEDANSQQTDASGEQAIAHPEAAGRDKSLRSIAGGLAHMPRPVARRAAADGLTMIERNPVTPALAADDLEASISEALRNDPALSGVMDNTSVPAKASQPLPAQASEEGAHHQGEDWEAHDIHGSEDFGDWAEHAESSSEPAEALAQKALSARRGRVSPNVLALSAAALLITLGVGGALAMRLLPFGSSAGDPTAQADASAPQLRDAPLVSADDTRASSGADAAGSSGSTASAIPSASAQADASPQPAAAPSAASAPAAASAPPSAPPATAAFADRVAVTSPAAAAEASPAEPDSSPRAAPSLPSAPVAPPAADPPQTAAPAIDLGPARRVATTPVKPASESESAARATEAETTPAPSGDDISAQPPLPPSRKTLDEQHAKPHKPIEASERKATETAEHKAPETIEHKVAKPAAPPAPKAASKPATTSVAERAAMPAPPQATEPPPSGVASVLQNVFGGKHDAPSTSATASNSGENNFGPRAGARWGEASPVGTTTIARSGTAPAPVMVKLASSVSEQAAQETLSRLQKQFPGLLTSGSVRREDMGKFGVFYRVRVGPLSREAADKVCAQLKAAGASCSMTGG
jgi:hypothetical protein